MKIMKKFISAVLTVALIICLMPGITASASAATLTEGDWEYTVSGGNATITRNLRNHGGDHYSPYTMAIPSTLGGYPVTAIGDRMISNSTGLGSMGRASVTNLTIPNGVITIGEYAFDGLNGLTSLTIPDSVTTIGDNAFRGCLLLTSVTIGNGVTTIGNSAFSGCRELTSVTIPLSVTTIGYAVFTMNSQPLPNLTIRCYENSAAHIHAKDEGLKFELITGTPPATPPPTQEIKVLVNGTAVAFDQPPIIENGRTLVPLRAIFEALGATVEWEQSTQTVTAVKDDITIILKIGDAFLTKNGERIALDVPAKIVGGRTLVPARAVAESFGADVQWDQATRTVTITE